MAVLFTDYNIEILDKVYKRYDGKSFEQTARISFVNEKNELIENTDYGVYKIKELYDQIENHEEINLNNSYVFNFSLNTYRRLRLLEKKEYVKLKTINASNAFFESSNEIDFSYVEFTDGNLNFENTVFGKGKISFNYSKFAEGSKNFSYTVFHKGDFEFSNCELENGELNFKNSIFKKGIKNFQYTDFGSSEVIFTNAEFFEGDFIFINTIFNKGKLNFKVARFNDGKLDFRYAKFTKTSISFERTDFGSGRQDFKTIELTDSKINFNRAEFNNGDLLFDGSLLINSKLTFKRSNFGEGLISFEILEGENSEINFEKAVLSMGSVTFSNAKISELCLKSCHLNDYIDLRVSEAKYIDLSDTIVRDIIDLRSYDFKVNIKTLNFINLRLLGRIYIDWDQNNVYELINSQGASYAEIAGQFLTLKENFNTCGQYDFEDKSYVEFKRNEQKAKLLKNIEESKFSAIWQYPWYFFKTLVFDKMGLYATDPLRVLISMVVTYLIFSLLFILTLLIDSSSGIMSGIGGDHATLSLVGRSLYHSAITFLTIGYGDFYPMGFVRFLSGIEGFTGLFLMSYFTVAFVRKILR